MLKTYEYHRPAGMEEACSLLAELPEAQVLAGGTDLLLDIEASLRNARHLVSLKQVAELKQIEESNDQVSIGAGCTAFDVQTSPLIRDSFPEITEMVVKFASPQIRSRATVAGNICSAVPCGDFPVILIALGAQLELVSIRGARILALESFFVGPRETVRDPDELLTRIIVPKKKPGSAACFLKFQRRASNSLAVASVAGYLHIPDGVCQEARIALGAVAPVPLLARQAGASLVGNAVDRQGIARAAQIARDEAEPITDVRGTEAYRRELILVLCTRVLRQVADNVTGQPTGEGR